MSLFIADVFLSTCVLRLVCGTARCVSGSPAQNLPMSTWDCSPVRMDTMQAAHASLSAQDQMGYDCNTKC